MEARLKPTQKTLKKLQKAHEEAVRDKKKSFIFEGHEYLTSYSKYLIEYLLTLKLPKQ